MYVCRRCRKAWQIVALAIASWRTILEDNEKQLTDVGHHGLILNCCLKALSPLNIAAIRIAVM